MKFVKFAVATSALALIASAALAAPIAPGSVVVYRIGNATNNVLANTGSPVFVDVYTTGGVLSQSIALPTAGANALIASGTATSEGLLSVSPNGRFISITGYNTPIGGSVSLAGTTGTTVARSVAVIDSITGSIAYSTYTDFASGNNPRSAVTDDGTNLWFAGGAGGVRYGTIGTTAGTSTQLSTTVTNIRQVNIFGGQLFNSDSSGAAIRLGAVGTGLPTTSGQTIVNIPGFPVSGSPYGFFFADLSATVAGNDTLYVASDDAAALTKYSLVAGSWVSNGTVGAAADAYRGVTGSVGASGEVNLFATRLGGSSANGGGELLSLTDLSGYNGAFVAAPTVLSTAVISTTAGTFNTSFRGVGLVIPAPGSVALVGLAGLFAARRRRA